MENCSTPFIELSRVIQGEGRLMGQPFLLLRVWGCPYRCKFGNSICDTSYAWKMPDLVFSYAQALQFVRDNRDIKNIMITGGEPTSWDTQEMVGLITALKVGGKFVLIETAGYKIPRWHNLVDEWSISPKVGAIEPNLINWSAIADMVQRGMSYLKFVVQSESQAEEIFSIVGEKGVIYPNQFPSKLWLMPEGVTESQLSELRPKILDLCSSRGVAYSDRLHIVAFGKETLGK